MGLLFTETEREEEDKSTEALERWSAEDRGTVALAPSHVREAMTSERPRGRETWVRLRGTLGLARGERLIVLTLRAAGSG